jgi:hypothetical protein
MVTATTEYSTAKELLSGSINNPRKLRQFEQSLDNCDGALLSDLIISQPLPTGKFQNSKWTV